VSRRIALLTFVLALLAADPARAHKLKVFATASGARIDGTVYFVGGSPARGARIVMQAPDGTPLAILHADEHGRFATTAAARVDHVIIIDAGDGHSGRFTVPGEDLPATLPTGLPAAAGAVPAGVVADDPPASPTPPPVEPDSATAAPPPNAPDATALQEMIEAAVARQVRPLREQLNAYEDQVRLRDVLGGLGFVLGLAGLAVWLRTRRAERPGR
jgi:nickel transport protein